MLIELRKGMPLHPGTLNAVIAPEKVMISALNSNTDLQRFLFMISKEAGHMVVLLEYDPKLLHGVETLMLQIMGMLKEAGCEPLVLLYAPSSDRSSTVLMRQTDLIIKIVMTDESTSSRTPHHSGVIPYAQLTLEVS
jgi:hypothetical protein